MTLLNLTRIVEFILHGVQMIDITSIKKSSVSIMVSLIYFLSQAEECFFKMLQFSKILTVA